MGLPNLGASSSWRKQPFAWSWLLSRSSFAHFRVVPFVAPMLEEARPDFVGQPRFLRLPLSAGIRVRAYCDRSRRICRDRSMKHERSLSTLWK